MVTYLTKKVVGCQLIEVPHFKRDFRRPSHCCNFCRTQSKHKCFIPSWVQDLLQGPCAGLLRAQEHFTEWI